MRQITSTLAVLAASAGMATAGGVERSTQSTAILFETGNYAELSFGVVAPDVSGVLGVPVGPFPAGAPSGSMLADYTSYALGIKKAVSDRVDIAVMLDQPIGANTSYPGTFGLSPYPMAGTTAKLSSTAVTGLLRYRLQDNFSVFGGLRIEQVEGDVSIPFLSGYRMTTDRPTDLGYVLGIAWENPEIAARVALSYNSAITHTLGYVESGPALNAGTFESEVPQSLNLEFQTGVAADTLLFGSVRWVDWTAFTIDPAVYNLVVGEPLVWYRSDRVTYNLGLGHRFSDTWSGAVMLAHEPSNGDITGNLGPTDGFTSVGLAATYSMGNSKITAGLSYVDIGGATTGIGARFSDNSGIGAGLRVGFNF